MPASSYESVADEAAHELLPLAYIIPEDEQVRSRVERFIRGIGATAVEQVVDYEPGPHSGEHGSYTSLLEMLRAAADGDTEARTGAQLNAQTHIWECLTKAGITFDTVLATDRSGRIVQRGQVMEQVYENSWQWAAGGPEMRERTLREIYNGFLAETWLRLGLLEGQRIVVFSPYPTEPTMTDERARKIGFFPDTMSCVIQSITMRGGQLVQEVAFVAGVTKPGGPRHDIAAIQALTAELGAPITANTSGAILGTPLVMSSDVTLLDLVRGYDRHAGTFFGQDQPQQDYEAYVAECRVRLHRFEPLVQATMDELVAVAHTLHHPTDATRMLHDVAQRHMVAAAAEDNSIDVRVFGPDAVQHVEAARQAFDSNDWLAYNVALDRAQRTAVTGSCPIEEESGQDGSGSDALGEQAGDNIPAIIRCIKCRRFSPRTAIEQPDKSWRCPKCALHVDVCTGKVLHESVQSQPEPEEPPEPFRLPVLRPLLAAA